MKSKKKIISLVLVCMLIFLSYPFNNNIYANTLEPTNVTEEYLGEMPEPMKNFGVEVYKNKAYIMGGVTDTSTPHIEFKMQVYDLETGLWSNLGDIPATKTNSQYHIYTTLYKTNIYVLLPVNSMTFELLKYDINTNVWSAISTFTGLGYTSISYISMICYNNELYLLSEEYNKILKYNIETQSHIIIDTIYPKELGKGKIIPYNNKLYCFGGYGYSDTENGLKTSVYDLETGQWSLTSSMDSWVNNNLALRYNDYFYMLYAGGEYSDIKRYDIKNDVWTEVRVNFKRKVISGEGAFVKNGYIYRLGGWDSNGLIGSIYRYKISETSSLEEEADRILSDIENGIYDESNKIQEFIEQLPDTPDKDDLLDRYETIADKIPEFPTMELKSSTSNADIYIKSENILSMTLDTNTITFEDFSGIEDMEKPNAINITISSSLPYELNAYLIEEIQNADKTKTMDKSILNIKENTELVYQTFKNTTDKLTLKENCNAGNDLIHHIDLKLKGGIPLEKDVYRAIIKFEAQQK